MAFTHPEAFRLFILFPALFMILVFSLRRNKRDRLRFAESELYRALTRSMSLHKRRLRSFSLGFGSLFLVLALTGPRFGTKTEIVTRMGVDIVIALDTSYSMLAEDVRPNRLLQAKYEIGRLIDNLQGDRVALVAFAGDAIIQCPLTADYNTARTFLDYIDIGIVPVQGTNLELAINRSIELFERGSGAENDSRLIILVTDGESITGDPVSSTRRAGRNNIRIFTIGMGTSGGEIIPIRNEDGAIEDYKKDSKGNVVKTRLDEKTLIEIAEKSDGSYLRTVNGEVNIQEIIDELGSMHKTDIHERKISRLKERYQIPLGIALFFLIIWYSIGERQRIVEK